MPYIAGPLVRHTGSHEGGHFLSPSVSLSPLVMALSGCQLDCIWNELQDRNGRHACDSDLEARRQTSDPDL